ncbi:ubiquitin carboxyl-terminal hydrolase 36 [Astyanax mexicanus]|uniref:ubiquitin carboxyl-terminal hydrolase 36 n=1 Tax=Astyanax mexicanus TaxID=7994 RepID=UPI0020CB5F6D|nr:ubiquitin carboxyl-terminal hydrolase 36 [Astyanax mexicanus]
MDKTLKTPDDSVELNWREVIPVGAGLENKGNICYVNSVLQCLTYTPPLTNYLLYGEHSKTCQGYAVCMMCAMEEHVKQVFCNPGRVIYPEAMLNLSGGRFKSGFMHGARRYLQFTLKALHQSYLNRCRLNGQSVGTSLVQQIFHGYLQVTTICGECCGRVSQRYKLFQILDLEIKKMDSIRQALTQRFQALTQGFQAQLISSKSCDCCCKSCKTEAIQDLPTALVISLNRSDGGKKITKFVSYPETLDMSPFMSQSSGAPEIYNLYAVLVHSGSSNRVGHFYSHVKASDGKWYLMNDISVSKSQSSLKQKAYILFYIRSPNPADVKNSPEPTSSNTGAA